MITSKDHQKSARLFAKTGRGQLYYLAPEIEPNIAIESVAATGCTHLPNLNTRDVLYIVGPSGSGKSTYAAKYIKAWQKAFPEQKFILFSKVPEDSVLDKLSPHRVLLDQSLIDEPIELLKDDDLDHDLLMFDDIDTLTGQLQEAVYQILRDALELGRHKQLTVVICCHQVVGADRKMSRMLLNEMTTLTLFPSASRGGAIVKTLTTEFDMGKQKIRKLFKAGSRWVTLFTQFPRAYLREDGFGLL